MLPTQRLIWTDYRSWSTDANNGGPPRGGPMTTADDAAMRSHGTIVERMQGAAPPGETAILLSPTLSGGSGGYSTATSNPWTLTTPHVRPDGSTIATTPIPRLAGVVNVSGAASLVPQPSATVPVPAGFESLPNAASYPVDTLGVSSQATNYAGLGGYHWSSTTAGWVMLEMERPWMEIIRQSGTHAWLGDAGVPTATRSHVRNAAIDTVRWHATRVRSAFPGARVCVYSFPTLANPEGVTGFVSADPARSASLLHWTLPASPLTTAESAWIDAQAALWAPACEHLNVLCPQRRPFYWSNSGNGLNYQRGWDRANVELAVRVRRLLGRDRRSIPIVCASSPTFHYSQAWTSQFGGNSTPFDGSGNLMWSIREGLALVPIEAATSGTTRLLSFREHMIGDAITAGADGVWLLPAWNETYDVAMTSPPAYIGDSAAYARHRMTLDLGLVASVGAPDTTAMLETLRAAGSSTWGTGNHPLEVAYRAWWEDAANQALVAAKMRERVVEYSRVARDEMIRRSTRVMARRATVVSLMSATGPSQPGQGGGG